MNFVKYLKKSIVLTVLFFLVNVLSVAASENTEDKNNVIKNNSNSQMKIAITFDDGPHPRETDKILDILEKYDAKATFFVVGKHVNWYTSSVIRASKLGHEIGNHTYSHPDMNKISVDRAIEEILKTQNIIESITGKKPELFRAPGGIFSDELITNIEELECKPILWSWRQDTKDWCHVSVKSIVNGVVNNLQNGDIILFHDFNVKGSPTPQALELLLPKLKNLGYSFVTVSELLELNQVSECG